MIKISRFILVFSATITMVSAVGQRQEKDSLRYVLKTMEQQAGFEADTNYLDMLSYYGYLHWSSSPDSVILLSNQLYSYSENIGYSNGIIKALGNLGTGYFEKGDYAEALRYEQEGVAYAIRVNDQIGLAVLYHNMSLVYIELGMYANAQEVSFKALTIALALHIPEQEAENYVNLAGIYTRLEQYDEAYTHYQKALNIYKDLGRESELALIYGNLGGVYQARNENEKALEAYQEGMRISILNGDLASITLAKFDLGYFLMTTGKPEEALPYFLEIKKVQQEVGNKTVLTNILISLSECYARMQQYNQALSIAKEGLALAEAIGNPMQQQNAHAVLSTIYTSLRNFELALTHYQSYKTLSDSISTNEGQQKMIRLEEKFAYNQKEIALKEKHAAQASVQQLWIYVFGIGFIFTVVTTLLLVRSVRRKQLTNTLLQKNRDEINKQKEELEAMDIFKNRLLSVVSHDVRGPLNSLNGMLKLFEKQTLTKEEIQQLMENVNTKVGNVTVFVNDLLLWAKTQMTSAEIKASRFELKATIDQTIALLKPMAERKKINLKTNLLHQTEVEADEEMIKIVIRNLVSNAIKFCNEDDVIEVSSRVEPHDNTVIVSVRDSGVGIPADKVAQLFSSPNLSSQGTNHEMGTGLGLLLSKEYIKMNNGLMGVESEVGKGSRFWFTLPVLQYA